MATGIKGKLDVDSGYIIKSPCRDCRRKTDLPACSENCRTLSQVQALLVGIVSCSNGLSEHEAFPVLSEF